MTDIAKFEEDEELLPPPEKVGDYLKFLKSEWHTLSWLSREFTTQRSRRWMYLMLVLCIIQTSVSLSMPYGISLVANGLIGHASRNIWLGFALFVSAGVLNHVLSYFAAVAREYVLGLNHCRMDERITEILMDKPLGVHERYASQLNQASIDKGYWKTNTLQETIVFQALPAIILVLVALIGLWLASPTIGLVGTVVGVIFVAWSLWLNFNVGRAIHPIEKGFRRNNRRRIERWEKVNRVVTNGLAQEEEKILSTTIQNLMTKDRIFWIWFIKFAELRGVILQRLFQGIVLSYGAYLVWSGEWQIGVLFPLLMWGDIFTNNLQQLSNNERRIGQDIVPVQLMIEALQIPSTFNANDGDELERNGPLHVEFQNVSFSYKDAAEGGMLHPVLQNISFKMKPGERVALLGPSGAGKTTAMKLLLRFDDPTEGQILVNDKPLTSISLPSYMRQVGYIPQQSQIFDGTIELNLLYGVPDEEKKRLTAHNATELWNLMRSLKIDFGKRLNQGLDTLVGRHGLKLSGGQSQRLMIGAAVAKIPRLIVADEPTSSLDSVTEKDVGVGLDEALKGGTTALIVAHRLSTVRRLCTWFIVLKPIDELEPGESQIEAQARSFEELAQISPTFQKLAQEQGVTI